jgi:hypothetical protein
MIRPFTALLLTTALLGGCSDATGPDDDQLIGLFQLETVDGDDLPATVFNAHVNDGAGGFTLVVELLDGTVEFHGDHEYEQVVDRRGFADGEPIPLGRFIDRSRWVRGNGSQIVLESSLFQNLTTFGTLDGATLILEQDLSGENRIGGKTAHRFEEIGS